MKKVIKVSDSSRFTQVQVRLPVSFAVFFPIPQLQIVLTPDHDLLKIRYPPVN